MNEPIASVMSGFLADAVRVCERDVRVMALLLGGSHASRSADDFSDLDLVIVCSDQDYETLMAARREFAGQFGELLSAFSGEHVGEPRLLICLFDNPLLHVDLKFVTVDALAERVENPLVLLDKDGSSTARLAHGKAEWPSHTPEWFEERFWIWMHYGACKIARGELFEAIDLLSWVRGVVLGPMIARKGGYRQRGMRHIETESPAYVDALAATLANHEKTDCWRALRKAIHLYLDLRSANPPMRCDGDSERAVLAFIETQSHTDEAGPIPDAD